MPWADMSRSPRPLNGPYTGEPTHIGRDMWSHIGVDQTVIYTDSKDVIGWILSARLIISYKNPDSG